MKAAFRAADHFAETGVSGSYSASLPSADRPIDLVHLSKYTLGDRSLEGELLGLFRAQAGLYIDRLAAAASPKDWQDAAHSLKGSARGVGAWALAELAERAEKAALGDDEALTESLAGLRDAVALVTVFIDDILTD